MQRHCRPRLPVADVRNRIVVDAEDHLDQIKEIAVSTTEDILSGWGPSAPKLIPVTEQRVPLLLQLLPLPLPLPLLLLLLRLLLLSLLVLLLLTTTATTTATTTTIVDLKPKLVWECSWIVRFPERQMPC